MATKKQRVAALATALFFLAASAVTTVAVLWTMFTQKNKTDTPADTSANQQTTQTNPLVGTKMANFTPVASVPTLVITDIKVGTGAVAKAGATVKVDYVGALAKDGTIFDASTAGQPATIPLSQVIEGWQKGVPGMKVGGVRRLLIPAAQGYGSQSPSASIPANSDLVFDITLQGV